MREAATLDGRAPSRTESASDDHALSNDEARPMTAEPEELPPPPPLTPIAATFSSAPAVVDTVVTLSDDPTPDAVAASTNATASHRNSTDTPTDGIATTSGLPYTTFQQLEYLPVLPPSVLSSNYVIPPTYEAVLSASPMPSQDGFRNGMSPELRSASPALLSSSVFTDATAVDSPTPLLSPVSLLTNPTARNAGPPGLFFVTKGKDLTTIVVSAAYLELNA